MQEQLKAERLKAELITNVSHDIKTPLTSIINYVDLLKKNTDPERQQEYLEVLDRQSQRLKKLTEDVLESSKASSGNIDVHLEPTSAAEIIDQALGEYQDRLDAADLNVIVKAADCPPMMADGRLLWRVLRNLPSNVCKYAQPGTRVYINAAPEDKTIRLTMKNISKAPLNISSEELMERFVRGDSSRHTEGSGLGLSIAQSLVELMHGRFSIIIEGDIEGDLFRADIILPRVQ
jgi:signal transduction histidine kinase